MGIFVVERAPDFIGPFETFAEAEAWADEYGGDATDKPDDFSVEVLIRPEDAEAS